MKRLLFALIACTQVAQAFICRQVDVLYNKKLNQTIFVYPDGHIDSNSARDQRSNIVWQANMLSKAADTPEQGVCVFVEDMLTVCHPHEQMEQFVARGREAQGGDLNKQVLNGLVAQLVHCGIPVINAEFRQLETASLCRLRVNASEAIDHLYAVINELQYAQLDSPYQKIINSKLAEFDRLIAPLKPFIESLRADDASLGKMLKKVPYDSAIDTVINRMNIGPPPTDPEERKLFVLNYYDVPLLELCILKGIAQRPQVQNIIVCAGGAHTAKLVPMLKQVGFESVATYAGTHPPKDTEARERMVDVRAVIAKHAPVLPSKQHPVLPPLESSKRQASYSLPELFWAIALALCCTTIIFGRPFSRSRRVTTT